ncbi:MAG: SIMPL domain-containing protein [Oscillospiraceae bacterium]|nr:SIMPL domain-containing protein [Oscillospiraceae bacterium]
MMERTITVRGTAAASVKPDLAELSLYLESEARTYEAASEKAAQDEKLLRQAAADAGLDADALRTESYNVSVHSEQRRAADGTTRSVFVGYVCSHALVLKFGLGDGCLQRVLDALASCKAKPRFDIAFTAADEQTAGLQLLAAACADAKRRAQTLASASDAKLGQLLHIEYDGGAPVFRSMSRMNADGAVLMARAAAPKLSPQDISLEDGALFTWALE